MRTRDKERLLTEVTSRLEQELNPLSIERLQILLRVFITNSIACDTTQALMNDVKARHFGKVFETILDGRVSESCGGIINAL